MEVFSLLCKFSTISYIAIFRLHCGLVSVGAVVERFGFCWGPSEVLYLIVRKSVFAPDERVCTLFFAGHDEGRYFIDTSMILHVFTFPYRWFARLLLGRVGHQATVAIIACFWESRKNSIHSYIHTPLP